MMRFKKGINNKVVFSTIFVLIVILIIGIVLFFLLKPTEVECDSCSLQSFEEMREITIDSIEKGNMSLCEGLLDVSAVSNCKSYFKEYYSEHLYNKYCINPEDERIKIRCRIIDGLVEGDYSKCGPSQTGEDYDDVCYYAFAINLNNQEICDSISLEGSRIICNALVLGDIDECKNIQDPTYNKVCQAFVINDVSICQGEIFEGDCTRLLKMINAFTDRTIYLGDL